MQNNTLSKVNQPSGPIQNLSCLGTLEGIVGEPLDRRAIALTEKDVTAACSSTYQLYLVAKLPNIFIYTYTRFLLNDLITLKTKKSN